MRKMFLAVMILSLLITMPALARHGTVPGWIKTPSGCVTWNPHPVVDESVHWTGECVAGKLSGQGVFIWYVNGKVDVHYEGEMRGGKRHGRGVYTKAKGGRYEGEWRGGKIYNGILTKANGKRTIFRNGRRVK